MVLKERTDKMTAIIGITSQYRHLPEKTMVETNKFYIDAVTEAGGLPLIIPLGEDRSKMDKYLDLIDGIIFSGGDDILPIKYGEEPLKGIGDICLIRDDWELELLNLVLERSLPILGICRGLQVLNTGLGGTLYQDLPSQKPDIQEHISVPTIPYGFHNISLVKDSFLEEIFEKDELFVNSLHHQAIKDLGQGLKVSAYAKDGIVEAVESLDGKPIYGLQFHPEAMIKNRREFLKIFEFFLRKCQPRS